MVKKALVLLDRNATLMKRRLPSAGKTHDKVAAA
jgi:hypothetical protein